MLGEFFWLMVGVIAIRVRGDMRGLRKRIKVIDADYLHPQPDTPPLTSLKIK
jgi:hypothetical protein